MGYIVSGVVAALLGFISAKTFFAHSWTALIPWALFGVLTGWVARSKKDAVWRGAIYGFILPVSFTFFGYQGSKPMSAGFYLLAMVLGVVGAGATIILALIGKKFHKN